MGARRHPIHLYICEKFKVPLWSPSASDKLKPGMSPGVSTS